MAVKFRYRKLRTFTIDDDIFDSYRQHCTQQKKVMSRELEKFMKKSIGWGSQR